MIDFARLVAHTPGLRAVLLMFVGLGAVLGVSAAVAQVVEVNHIDSEEVQRLELEKGELADITVYLKTIGDTVDGYKIILVDNKTGRTVASLTSDIHGIVVFEGLREGKYTAAVIGVPQDDTAARIGIGDVRINKHDFEKD